MIKRALLVALVSVMLVGCYHMGTVMDLQPGMSKDQVINLIGYPSNRATSGNNVERWYYHSSNQILVFQRNELVALEYDHEGRRQKMEIEKARAGATKIINNNVQGQQSNSTSSW